MTEYETHMEGVLSRLSIEMDVHVGLVEELTDRVAALEECARVTPTTESDDADLESDKPIRGLQANLRFPSRRSI